MKPKSDAKIGALHISLKHQLLQREPCQAAEDHIDEGMQIEIPVSSGEAPSPLITIINFAKLRR